MTDKVSSVAGAVISEILNQDNIETLLALHYKQLATIEALQESNKLLRETLKASLEIIQALLSER